ncbi:hypothetical protein IFM89_025006 [Coptis chinensis]|uniref:Protein kinase domain-containing protein n=1 Tax=Coptis chinensis TaxID=261450 RepID=A0A835LSC1_9MAGN|nr:hypothetical protein IFM89_025006 [Coptis chinensis]
MENEVVGTSGRQVQKDLTTVVSGSRFRVGQPVQNVSVQTGEEFSLEFIQDRATIRRVPIVPDMDQGQLRRGRSNINKNLHVRYEDLTGILGLKRMNSECSYDASDAALRKGYVMEVENMKTSENASRYYDENGVDGKESRKPFEENSYQAASRPMAPPMPILSLLMGLYLMVREHQMVLDLASLSSFAALVGKYCQGQVTESLDIIIFLPGEDLDALISVSSDEDLQNMLEEYNGIERIDGQRLRLFLISTNESESPSSFEARAAEQGSSEYEYVVAVNGVMDPSPRKGSNGLLGQISDGASNFYKGSPTSLHPLEVRDGVSPSNVMGMFSRPPAQYFIATQNASNAAAQSPPYSPLPIQRRDSKGSHLHVCEDDSCHCSNESSISYVTDQSVPDSYIVEGTSYYYPTHSPVSLIDLNHPRGNVFDAEKPSKSRGVQFQERRPVKGNEIPPAIGRNNSDLDGYTCERPLLLERGFHSEKILSQANDRMGLLSGSNDSVGSQHGMPHVFSDSRLQEHGEKSTRFYQEGTTSSSPLNFSTTVSPALVNSSTWRKGPLQLEENTKFSNDAIQNKLPSAEPSSSPGILDLPKFSQVPEFCGRDETVQTVAHGFNDKYHTTTEASNLMTLDPYPGNPEMRLDMLNLMNENDSLVPQEKEHHGIGINNKLLNINQHPISLLDACSNSDERNVPRTSIPASSLADMEEKPQGYPSDIVTSELVRNLRPAKDESSSLNNCVQSELRNEENNAVACMPSCTDPRCSSIGVSCASSWPLDVALQKEREDQEPMLTSSLSLDPLAVKGIGAPKLNGDCLSWSSYQKANADASLRRGVSLLDDVCGDFPDQKVDMVEDREGYPPDSPEVEETTLVSSEPVHNFGQEIQLETVIVEDVTDSMPLDAESSSNIVPHVQDELFEDIGSPRLTDVESISPGNESEYDHDIDGNRDESISDATIAEIEAGIYGLQIIKNADLEEFRELGSGTFGTVYYGKWRGTDVAIKRIKKSCFSGRSSEQERLTKDFWREAQILSKLHHPNVVAFYGVVPDGSGGTLATVTEFMVNGSLRHVLLRKDRALDRRKKLIIAMDAAFGMEYLHSKNIVHFDLKCDNLLVNLRDSQRPICKVGDFGLSRIKRNTMVSGGVRGTLPWMAPELLNGSSSRVSEKVDVFSFGIAMWEILTGEEPYANMHCGAIIGGIVNNSLRPAIPDRCDSEWRKLMEQCWAADPSVRPSFTEITNRLRVMSMALQAKGQVKR